MIKDVFPSMSRSELSVTSRCNSFPVALSMKESSIWRAMLPIIFRDRRVSGTSSWQKKYDILSEELLKRIKYVMTFEVRMDFPLPIFSGYQMVAESFFPSHRRNSSLSSNQVAVPTRHCFLACFQALVGSRRHRLSLTAFRFRSTRRFSACTCN